MTLIILDPCINSVVDPNNELVFETPFEVSQGSDFKVETYSGPKDSESILNGNGYDQCGPLRYDVTFVDGSQPTNFEFLVARVDNNADLMAVQLSSEAYGLDIEEDVTVKISLIGYP